MSATLYEIGEDLDALAELLAEVGGDVSDEQADAAITAWLAETEGALAGKLDRYAALIRETEARSEARKAESARLSALAATDTRTVDRLKKRLLDFFTAHEMDVVQTERFRLSRVNNGGVLPLNLAVPPEALPEEYRVERVVVSANQNMIRAVLDAGGTLDFATLGPRGQSLRIK